MAAVAAAANELDVTYVGSTSLTIKTDDGTAVRSGATLPAGSYLIVVYDENDANPDFRINGPGISISSGLNTAMGMGNAFPLGPFTSRRADLPDRGREHARLARSRPASLAGSGSSNPAGARTRPAPRGARVRSLGRRQ